ncbi:MAG: hypothetical protein KO217_00590 [Methanobacteriaceae archaeon]|nr:hypothetical protein [Methanobacteriaceae archaeon]
MYQNKVYVTDLINKMGHISERFRLLSRTKSFRKEKVETIDYHLTEIMKILNECN